MSKLDAEVKKTKKSLLTKSPERKIDWNTGLSTGVRVLNYACSGRGDVGLLPGHIYILVGKSQAGKSWLGRQMMAEATINPRFKDYRLYDDDPENGAIMNFRRYFGEEMARRREEPPKGKSVFIDEFYENVNKAGDKGEPFIYLLDSEDALQPRGDPKAGFDTRKAIANSSGLRSANNVVEKTNSILIIVKQERQNIGFGSQFNPSTKSGGKALTHYASLELWFSLAGSMKKTVKGNKVKYGDFLKVHVKKNRISGAERFITLPFFYATGLSDIDASIFFLKEWKHWKGKKEEKENGEEKVDKIVVAPEFDFSGGMEQLAELIQGDAEKEKKLNSLVSSLWEEIEDEIRVVRRNRYQ